MALSLVVGGIAAAARLSGSRALTIPSILYIELVRGTPALVLLFIIYYGIAQYGILLPREAAAVIALSAFGGAFFAEIFRGGYLAVEHGQSEAALALGLSRRTTLLRVVLPQMVTAVIPPAANMTVDILKASALLVTIAAPELMYAAYQGASDTYRAMEFYAVAAAIYLVLAFTISVTLGRLEHVVGPAGD